VPATAFWASCAARGPPRHHQNDRLFRNQFIEVLVGTLAPLVAGEARHDIEILLPRGLDHIVGEELKVPLKCSLRSTVKKPDCSCHDCFLLKK
jgi:hypothetical protein